MPRDYKEKLRFSLHVTLKHFHYVNVGIITNKWLCSAVNCGSRKREGEVEQPGRNADGEGGVKG